MSISLKKQGDLLERYLALVVEANKNLNLTRIASIEEGRLLHLEDSLVALPEFNKAPDGEYVDLGTGGGFPGVPISIKTGRKALLVDSVGKKIAALDRIINILNLSEDIKTFAGRAEDLAVIRNKQFAVISARALASLPSLLELAAPLLQQQGHLICYKAQVAANELDVAKLLEKKLGMSLLSYRETILSDEKTFRSIIVFEKIAEPTVKLPRRPGMAQKRPYQK